MPNFQHRMSQNHPLSDALCLYLPTDPRVTDVPRCCVHSPQDEAATRRCRHDTAYNLRTDLASKLHH